MKVNIDMKLNKNKNPEKDYLEKNSDNILNTKTDNKLNKQDIMDNMVDGKKWVWIPCNKKVYKAGYILADEENFTKVQANVIENVLTSDVYKMNPPKYEQTEDLAALSYLNEYSVLYNLETRYASKHIYTYSGLFLVALNPYHALNIYGDDLKRRIIESTNRGRKLGDRPSIFNNLSNTTANIMENSTLCRGKTNINSSRTLPPHIFAVANEAYQSMVAGQHNQSILITGESGAGKTENTKRVIEFLTYAVDGEEGRSGFDIKQALTSTNVILEAFGNAKTVKNDNSSRFGRFVQIKFRDNQICGAKIEKYLLEKSRVVGPGPGERNFHIFYYLLKGLSADEKTRLGLTDNIVDYACLRDSASTPRGVDEAAEFVRVEQAFAEVGVAETRFLLYRALALVLHLSNLDFTDCPGGGCTAEPQKVRRVCDLLNITEDSLLRVIVKPVIHAGCEDVVGRRGAAAARAVIEGLMKTVYEWLFDRLISAINTRLDSAFDTFIGVLDIAGFEILKNNSFEQLCINYTNEKLQQYFNQHMFVLEQELYRNEQILWDFLDFGVDLEPTIALIESTYPIGVLSYVDEECVMPCADDNTLLEKIRTVAGVETVPLRKSFCIQHYAGRVEYNVNGWVRKNKDTESEELFGLILESMCRTCDNSETNMNCRDGYVGDVLQTHSIGMSTRVKKGVFKTVAQSHRESLNWLLRRLRETQPHFVRCIIPNTRKCRDEFDRAVVLNQLRCNGVLEGIRISRLGYPSRMLFAEFNDRYAVLSKNTSNVDIADDTVKDTVKDIANDTAGNTGFRSTTCSDSIGISSCAINKPTTLPRKETLKLLKHLRIPETQFRVGRTTIFFRQGVLGDLEDLRDNKIHAVALAIQRLLRSKLEVRRAGLDSERLIAVKQLQQDARACLTLLRSRWWSLFLKIQPLLDVKHAEDERKRYAEELAAVRKEVATVRREAEEQAAAREIQEVALQNMRGELARYESERIESAELVQKLLVEKKELSEKVALEKNQVILEKEKVLSELVEEKKIREKEKQAFSLEKNKVEKEHGLLVSELEMLRKCEQNHFDRQQRLEQELAEKGEAEKYTGGEIEKYKDMLQTKDFNYKALEEKYKALEATNEKTESIVNKSKDEYKILEDKLKILQDKYNSLENNYNLLQDNYANLEATYKTLKNNHGTLSNQLTQCKEDLHVANDRLSDKQSAYDRFKEQNEHIVASLRQDLVYQRERNNKTQNLFTELKAMQNVSTVVAEPTVVVSADGKAIAKLRSRLAATEKMVNDLKRDKEALYAENLELTQNKLNEIFASENEANRAKAALANEIRRLEQENRGLRNELATLSPSGSECSDDAGYERLLLVVDEERRQRMNVAKRVVELESANLLLENELNTAREAVVVSNENESLTKHVVALAVDLEKVRKALRRVSEVFSVRFMALLENLSGDFADLRAEWLSDKSKLVEKGLRAEEATLALASEVKTKERVMSELAQCRTKIECAQVEQKVAAVNIRELEQHIAKLELRHAEREEEVSEMRMKYNEAVSGYATAAEDYERKRNELYEKIIHRDWSKLDNELARVRKECKTRMIEMSEELVKLRDQNDELMIECAKKKKEVEELSDFVANNMVFSRNVSELRDEDLVREHLVSSFVVDKDALRASEWKTLVDAKCMKCQNMVVPNDDSKLRELLLLKTRDMELESLRLRQVERDVVESNKIIETLKLCLSSSIKSKK